VLLWPFLPTTSEKIFAQLNLQGSPAKFELAKWGGLAPGHAIGEPAALFPRKDQPKKD
jgi:methionyl-tRNA synthetase